MTVTVNRSAPPQTTHANSQQVVAISNNFNARNKPYPVQESVTVVPLLQPISQYPPNSQPMNIGYPPQGPQYPQNFGNATLNYDHELRSNVIIHHYIPFPSLALKIINNYLYIFRTTTTVPGPTPRI